MNKGSGSSRVLRHEKVQKSAYAKITASEVIADTD
jgi:hypothetical protein